MPSTLDTANTIKPRAQPTVWRDKLLPALVAAALGVTLLWAAGFAEMSPLHDAAHDTRHAAALPCH